MLLALAPHVVNAADISITSPVDGSIYHPGDTITVNVDAPNGGMVMFLAQGNIHTDTPVLDQGPYIFTAAIPQFIAAGTYVLSATAHKTNPLQEFLPQA